MHIKIENVTSLLFYIMYNRASITKSCASTTKINLLFFFSYLLMVNVILILIKHGESKYKNKNFIEH